MHRNVVLLAVVAVLLLAGPAGAQITITSSELPRALGDSARHKYNIGTATVEVGSPGGPHIWNFDTSAFAGGLRSAVIVDKDLNPFGSEFPDANVCMRTVPDGETHTTYTFEFLDEGALNLLGFAMETPDTGYATIYGSWLTALALPLDFGAEWQAATSWQVQVSESLVSTVERFSRMSADGWGDASLPFGTVPCLRVNSYDTLISTMLMSGETLFSDTTGSRGYQWWSKPHGLVASAEGPVDDTSMVFTESDCYLVMVEHPVGAVAEKPDRGAREALCVASPFVGRTVVPGRAAELFELYDIAGKLVARQPGGGIGVGLPAGVYTVRSSSGHTTRAVKLN